MKRTRRWVAGVAGGLLIAAVTALAVLRAMGPADLQAWTPPAAAPLPPVTVVTGQVVGEGACAGPGNVAVDAAGRAYTLCRDGSLVMLAANASTSSTFLARTRGGFGVGFGPLGGLVVAGGSNGLFHVGGRPEADALLSAKDDPTLRFVAAVDDFKLTPEVLFVDASDRPARAEPATALLEHAGRGSLRRYNFRSKEAAVLLKDLQTPLAVAIGPEDRYALIAESGAYRILRYWLTGPQAGTQEVFADHLPGLVTGLSFNGNGRFWAALATGRHSVFDGLAAHPRIRALLSVLPWRWLPLHDDSVALGFDGEGKTVGAFKLMPADGIGRITSVVEHGPWLWIGSDRNSALVRVPLQTLVASAPPPPAGWASAPRTPQALTVKPPEDDD